MGQFTDLINSHLQPEPTNTNAADNGPAWASPGYVPDPYVKPEADKPKESRTWGDTTADLMIGGASVAEGAGFLLKKLGYEWEDPGQFVQDLGRSASEYWNDKLSDVAKQDQVKQIIRKNDKGDYELGDFNFNTLKSSLLQSVIPSMAGMGAGGAISKGLLSVAPKIGPSVAGMIGFGSGEGIISSGQTGANVEAEIAGMSHEKLMNSPDYKAIYDATGSDRIARKSVSDAASGDAAAKAFITTTLLSAPMGALFGKIVAGVPLKTTKPRAMAATSLGEGGQEFLQSGAEQLDQNAAIKQYADPTKDLSQGVLESAASGFVAGTAMGGALSFHAKVEQAKKKAEDEGGDELDQTVAGTRAAAEATSGIDNLSPFDFYSRSQQGFGMPTPQANTDIPISNEGGPQATEQTGLSTEQLPDTAPIDGEFLGKQSSIEQNRPQLDRPIIEGELGYTELPDGRYIDQSGTITNELPTEGRLLLPDRPIKTRKSDRQRYKAQAQLPIVQGPQEAYTDETKGAGESIDPKRKTTRVALSDLTLSKDVPQFKSGANKDGIVEKLGGQYDETGMAPIQVWVRNDGRKEIITGRHRFDLAKRSGKEDIPAQLHYEKDGFTADHAKALDAILNIRDNQGSVKDYVTFFKNTGITREEADRMGVTSRQLGRRAFTIAETGSDSLITALHNDQITEAAAEAIARVAPNNEKYQAVGLKALSEGKTQAVAVNMIRAAQTLPAQSNQDGDLFGFDDTAMKQAEAMAKVAAAKQRAIKQRISAVKGAAKNPEVARKEGVNVNDPEGLNKRIAELEQQAKNYEEWHKHSDILAEIRDEVAPSGFNLETQTEQSLAEREAAITEANQSEAQAKQEDALKAEADQQAGEFTLAGSDRSADVAMANGQEDIFADSAPMGAEPAEASQSESGNNNDVQENPVATEKEYHSELAERAYSHSNRYGARVSQEAYVKFINDNYAELNTGLNERQKELLDESFIQLKKDYLEKEKSVLNARSGVASAHIAGRSKFNQKQASDRGKGLDSAEAKFTQWAKGQIEHIKNLIKSARNNEQVETDNSKQKAKQLNKSSVTFARTVSTMNEPGWDKSLLRRQAAKEWEALKEHSRDDVVRTLETIESALVKRGSSLDKAIGSRSQLWKDIDNYLNEDGAESANSTNSEVKDPIDLAVVDTEMSSIPSPPKGGRISNEEVKSGQASDQVSSQPSLYTESISDKAFVVKGDTKANKDKLKALRGRWNGKAKGWMFSEKRREEIETAIKDMTSGAPVTATTQEAPANKESTESAESKDAERKAKRLELAAERLERTADKALNQDRQTNTNKRAREAANAIGTAHRQQQDAAELRAIANAIRENPSHPLNAVQSTKDLYAIKQLISVYNLHEFPENLTHTHGAGYKAINDDVRNATIAQHVKRAEAKINETHWGDLLKALDTTRGYKTLANKYRYSRAEQKRVSSINDEDLKKISKFVKTRTDYWAKEIGEKITEHNRYKKLGIDGAGAREKAKAYMDLTRGKKFEKKVSAVDEKLKYSSLRGQYKDLDFFNTTPAAAKEVIDLADLEPGMTVLEPSAGVGHLADAAAEVVGKKSVTTNEIAPGLNTFLKDKGYSGTNEDFLEMTPEAKYDRVIMNPPFSKDQEIAHIEHAYKFLKPGGRLVAITSSMAGERSNKRNQNFKEWLDEVGAEQQDLPDASFKDAINPTNVNTKVITIDKREDNASNAAMFSLTDDSKSRGHRKVNLINVSDHGPVNRKQAMVYARKNLLGHHFINNDKGYSVYVGRKGLDKSLSNSAIKSPSLAKIHFQTVESLPSIIKEAIEVERREGSRDSDKHLDSVIRMYAGIQTANGPLRVKLTIKKTKRDGDKFYTYELQEIQESPVGVKSSATNDSTPVRASGTEGEAAPNAPLQAGALGKSILYLDDLMQGAELDDGSVWNGQGSESKNTSKQDSPLKLADNVATPVSNLTMRAVISRVTKAWANKTDVVAVDNFSELPESIKSDAKKRGVKPHQVKGIYHEGKVYIVRENLGSMEDVERALFHEGYGHMGLRKVFGKDLKQAMNKLFAAIGGKKGLQDIASKNGVDLGNYENLESSDKNAMMAEELLAHIAQTNKPGIKRALKELVGSIRQWLRAKGFLKLSKVSNSELYALLKDARKAVESVKQANSASNTTSFSLSQDADRQSYKLNRTIIDGNPTYISDKSSITLINKHKNVANDFDTNKRLPDGHISHIEDGAEVWDAIATVFDGDQEKIGGTLTVQVLNNRIVAIHDIKVQNKTKGHGEQIVASILASNPDGVKIIEAIPSAKAFWDKMGTGGFYDLYNNSEITWADYERTRAKRDRQRGSGEFQQPGSVRQELSENDGAGTAREGVSGENTTSKEEDAALKELESWLDQNDSPMFSLKPDQSGTANLEAILNKKTGTILEAAKEWLAGNTFSTKAKESALIALTLRQLGDIGRKYLPQIKDYVDIVHKMLTDRNVMAEKAADHVDEWLAWSKEHQDESDNLANLMHDATLAGVDPSEAYVSLDDNIDKQIRILQEQARGLPGDGTRKFVNQINELRKRKLREPSRRNKYLELKPRYEKLSKEAKEYYKKTRDQYDSTQEEFHSILTEKIENAAIDGSTKKLLLTKLRLERESQKIEIYFPLARFGDYFVDAVSPSGERVYLMFDNEREQKRTIKNLKSENFSITNSGRTLDQRFDDGANLSFVNELLENLDNISVNDEKSAEMSDAIYQTYLQHLPDRSIRKQYIHRKGVKGFSQDAIRAFADKQMKSAYQLARLKHSDSLAMLMDDMKQAAKSGNQSARLYNEMTKRHEWVMNPTNSTISQKMTGLGFVWMLGVSPAAAAVNLTQTPVIAGPVLGSRFGYKKTFAEMLNVSRMFSVKTGSMLDKITDAKEREAFKHWTEMGLLDATRAHDLAGLAEQGGYNYSATEHKWMNRISFLFHRAEQFNREVTALAAYRLGMKKHGDHARAIKDAAEMTWDAHYDYTNVNRARFMQSNFMKVATQFKQYSQNTTYYLLRNLNNMLRGATKEEKRVARSQLLGTLSITAGIGGIAALPLSLLFSLASFVFSDDDEPYDAQTETYAYLAKTLGKDLADYIIYGAGGAGVSTRVSLDGMWLRDPNRDLEGQDLWSFYARQAVGPVLGGIAPSMFEGIRKIHNGQYQRGFENMVPKFVKDASKAERFWNEGATTLKGDMLKDADEFSGVDLFLQLAGLSDSEVSKQYAENSSLKYYESEILGRRKRLMNQYYMAWKDGDQEEKRSVLKQIQKFNKSWPQIKLSNKSLRQSIKTRTRYRKQAKDGAIFNKKLSGALERLDWAD